MQLTVYDSLKRQRLLQLKTKPFRPISFRICIFVRRHILRSYTVIWSINCIINLKTPRSRRLEKNIPFGYFDICTFSRISFRTNNFRVTRRVRDKKGYIFLMTNCFRSRLTMHQRRTPNFANEAAVDDSQQR